MKKLVISFLFSVLATNPVFATSNYDSGTILTDSDDIQKIVGLPGKYTRQDQTFKIMLPRDDLNITINGIKIPSAMGLTTWIKFKKLDEANTLVRANLVLTEDQINNVMQEVIDNHLNVTELHSHLMWESPKVMFMHIQGIGNTRILAMAINKVLEKMKETGNGQGDFPLGEVDASNTTFDVQRVERILGGHGVVQNGVYRIVLNRQGRDISPDSTVIPSANTKATFAGSEQTAVIDGDLAMQQGNLQKVLTVLHKAGISIVAIHRRPIDAKTTYVFLHYWGIGKPAELARGLRTAVDVSQLPDELPMVAANHLLRSALRAQPYIPSVHTITILSNYCHSNFCSSSQKLIMRQNVS